MCVAPPVGGPAPVTPPPSGRVAARSHPGRRAARRFIYMLPGPHPPAPPDADTLWGSETNQLRSQFRLQGRLGKGAYGTVVCARIRTTPNAPATACDHDQQRAIKCIIMPGGFHDEILAIRTLREIRLLRLMDHPNIVTLHGMARVAVDGHQALFLVLDFMDEDLSSLLDRQPSVPGWTVRSVMAQALSALAHLHARQIVHRDLKPQNVLRNRGNGVVKLCDFGMARTQPPLRQPTVQFVTPYTPSVAGDEDEEDGELVEQPSSSQLPARQMTEHVITRWYRAPEILLRLPYTAAVDVWSMGCIYKELLERVPGVLSQARREPLFGGGSSRFSSPSGSGQACGIDQLALICQRLGSPCLAHFVGAPAWCSQRAKDEVAAACEAAGAKWSGTEPPTTPAEEQDADVTRRLKGILPGATEEERSLLQSLVHFDPRKRTNPAAALTLPYLGREKLQRYLEPEPEQMAVVKALERAAVCDATPLPENEFGFERARKTDPPRGDSRPPPRLSEDDLAREFEREERKLRDRNSARAP